MVGLHVGDGHPSDLTKACAGGGEHRNQPVQVAPPIILGVQVARGDKDVPHVLVWKHLVGSRGAAAGFANCESVLDDRCDVVGNALAVYRQCEIEGRLEVVRNPADAG